VKLPDFVKLPDYDFELVFGVQTILQFQIISSTQL